MSTSSGNLDTSANAGRYSAGNAMPHLRPMPRPTTRAASRYSLQGAARPRFKASLADAQWLIGRHVVERKSDRTSALRKRVLSYRAERPHDSSVAKAVNDALKFIDRIPATATLPYVALAEDGEVNFYWRRKSLLIDVGFVGDGMMHYYVWDEDSGVDVDASIPFSGRSLPPAIVKVVAAVVWSVRNGRTWVSMKSALRSVGNKASTRPAPWATTRAWQGLCRVASTLPRTASSQRLPFPYRTS